MGVLLSPVKGLEVSYPRADLMAQMFHQGTKISIFWNHDSHIFALPEVCFVIIMRCPPSLTLKTTVLLLKKAK